MVPIQGGMFPTHGVMVPTKGAGIPLLPKAPLALQDTRVLVSHRELASKPPASQPLTGCHLGLEGRLRLGRPVKSLGRPVAPGQPPLGRYLEARGPPTPGKAQNRFAPGHRSNTRTLPPAGSSRLVNKSPEARLRPNAATPPSAPGWPLTGWSPEGRS